MEIIIRTDASVTIGSGHVMRCLTIAKKLRSEGCNVTFWMEPLEGNLIDYVATQGFRNNSEADYADMYIIDHYGIDIDWERQIHRFTKKVVVIDDLAREHDCDLLLDQNVVPNYETRYDGLVPEYCIKLLGPKYLIMRDEFIKVRQQITPRNIDIQRLLVFMGGSDPTNETIKILQALENFNFTHVDVVIGNGNVLKNKVQKVCLSKGYQYHCQIDYMASLMKQADFAIGAGGATMWERCYVGLPSSATIVADNQIITTDYADRLGVVKNLGWHESVTVETYRNLLCNIAIGDMGKKGLQLTANKKPNSWLQEILELK